MIILSMTPGEAAAGSSRPGDAGSGVDDAAELLAYGTAVVVEDSQ